MQIKEIKQEGLSYGYEVTIPANDIDGRINVKLQEVGKTVRIQGFRPGKVPLKILKQRYGKAVLGEILEEAVNETSQKILQDKALRAAAQPKIEVKSFDADADLVYSMDVEIIPPFDIIDFKAISLEKPVAEVADEAVKDTLDKLADQHGGTKKVDSDRASEDGDTLKIDYDGRTADDDVHHEGMKAEGHMLKLGANQFIEGFEAQLEGKKPGDKVEVKVTFPTPYNAAHLEGRDAIFDVVVHEIHEDAKGEANDALAERLGMKDLAALKDAIKDQLQKEYDNQSRVVVKKALLDALDDAYGFELPSTLLESEYTNIIDQVKLDRKNRGDETEDLTDEEQAEYRDIAERRVRLGIVLSEVGTTNKITVAEDELKRAVITEAQRYPGQEAQVFEYFSKNAQALESLRGPLFEEKTVEFILELATVTDKVVSADELALALDEEPEDKPESAAKKKAPAKKKAAPKKAAAKKGAEPEDKPESAAKKKAPAKKKAAPKKAAAKKAE